MVARPVEVLGMTAISWGLRALMSFAARARRSLIFLYQPVLV